MKRSSIHSSPSLNTVTTLMLTHLYPLAPAITCPAKTASMTRLARCSPPLPCATDRGSSTRTSRIRLRPSTEGVLESGASTGIAHSSMLLLNQAAVTSTDERRGTSTRHYPSREAHHRARARVVLSTSARSRTTLRTPCPSLTRKDTRCSPNTAFTLGTRCRVASVYAPRVICLPIRPAGKDPLD